MKDGKRIVSVTIRRVAESYADTSYLGEFSDHAKTEFSIDHHKRVANPHNAFQWFNPGSVEDYNENAEWIKGGTPEQRRQYWHDTMTRNAELDYKRMISLENGHWTHIGISAEAEIAVPSGPEMAIIQTIHSGGLWGIESDSGREYLESIEQEQIADLKQQLKALGFGTRAISTAFKAVKHSDQ